MRKKINLTLDNELVRALMKKRLNISRYVVRDLISSKSEGLKSDKLLSLAWSDPKGHTSNLRGPISIFLYSNHLFSYTI
jgi:hypothetical protein